MAMLTKDLMLQNKQKASFLSCSVAHLSKFFSRLLRALIYLNMFPPLIIALIYLNTFSPLHVLESMECKVDHLFKQFANLSTEVDDGKPFLADLSFFPPIFVMFHDY